MNNYDRFKQLSDAQAVREELTMYDANIIDDIGTILVKYNYTDVTLYSPNGLVTVFPNKFTFASQQGPVKSWPEGAKHRIWNSRRKEYIEIPGEDGVTRYWLLPEPQTTRHDAQTESLMAMGLVLAPHPEKFYVPVSPLPDYKISVNRQLKKEAKVKWQDFFEFLRVMWSLLPADPDPRIREDITDKFNDTVLMHDDRASWHVWVQFHRMNKGDPERFKEVIEDLIMERDLPYDVARVSNLQMSHTSHWDWNLVRKLGKAGRLDDLEEE